MTMRFGVLIPQDAPFAELAERWRHVEALGFDAAYVSDHTGDYRDLGHYWLDGWAVLAYVATRTSTIRVGTLVANPLLRPAAQLAKQAVALDHLSEGRLELGVGTGIAGFDHEAVGEPYWPPRERAGRFADYVAILDGVLRSGREFRYEGDHLRSGGAALSPPPVQRPRPPITVGGQSPTVLKVAARYADCWNTHGLYGRTVDEIAEITARQNAWLDAACAEHGRDPAALRRSVLMFESLDAWASRDAFERVVHRFHECGVREFVAFWPDDDRRDLLERAAGLLPGLRG